MSRDLFKVVRVAPSQTLFQDVSKGEKPIPEWLKTKARDDARSPAASVQTGSRDRGSESSRLRPQTRRAASESQMPSPAADPLYDARMQSESLAAEMRESWRVPAPAADPGPGQEALSELAEAIVALEMERRELLKDSESAVLALVRVVTERVIGREIRDDSDLALRLVREGLAALEESTHTSILLGYGFEAQASALTERLRREGAHAEVVIDETLEPYACHLRSSLGSVDESLTTRLDAILSSLTGDADS